MLHFRSGSIAIAAAGSTYMFGGLAAAALALVLCGFFVHILSARRRRHDRDAARRAGHSGRRRRPAPAEEAG